MCTPTILAGMALSAVGSSVAQRQQSKNMASMISARNRATAANFERQDQFQRKSDAIFGDTLKGYSPVTQRMTEGAARTRRRSMSDRAIKQTGDYLPTSGSAPKIVADAGRKSVAAADQGSLAAGRRGADVASFGDTLFAGNLARGRSRDKLGEQSNYARGVATLLPLEQQAAYNNAYKAPGMFPKLLQMGGTGLSTAGMMGVNFGDLFATAVPPPGSWNRLTSMFGRA